MRYSAQDIRDSNFKGPDLQSASRNAIVECYNEMEELCLAAMAAGVPASRLVIRHPQVKFDRFLVSIDGGVGFAQEQPVN